VFTVPENLGWWAGEPGGAERLARLPRLAEELAERWSLELGEPFTGGIVSLVLAATRADGTPAVLKINFPEPESEHEAAALASWNGHGAARLLEHDEGRRALLLERCIPGTTLWELPEADETTRIAASVLRELHVPPGEGAPFASLAEVALRWADELPADWARVGRPFPRRLIDAGVSLLRELAGSQGPVVLVHQDLHGGNIVRRGGGWCAIDPKPLAGEAEFDTASYVRDRRDDLAGTDRYLPTMRRRLDVLAEELGLDRERMRGWAIGHDLAWGVEAYHEDGEPMVEAASLLLDG
jgi:streptomycin 6-kinase